MLAGLYLLAACAKTGSARRAIRQWIAYTAASMVRMINAQTKPCWPDFRSEERAFSLAIQAAGRAGRRGEVSRVIVQAWEPAGRAMQLAARGAVEEFLDGELERRRIRT